MQVRLLKFDDGERFPVLVDESGMPYFTPTVYTTSILRSSAGSYMTLVSKLRALMVLNAWAQKSDIDIEGRFRRLHFLSIDEIDDLVAVANLHYRDVPEGLAAKPEGSHRRIVNLEAVRLRAAKHEGHYVKTETAALRLRVIAGYLDWLAAEAMAKADRSSDDFKAAKYNRTQMKEALFQRIPKIKSSSGGIPREGLDPETQRRVREVIDPLSPENPWKGAHARARNNTFINLLLALGPRGGEVLVIRINDVDLGKTVLRIRRAPDEAEDPRIWKPNAKTLSRDLEFSENIRAMIQQYIFQHRAKIRGARRHPYLFVATGTGEPLSYSAVSKIFRVLRSKVPDLPKWFTAHICRYTWNDNFSAMMDEKGIKEDEEMKLREYSQGWVNGSQMPAKYARRHIRNKAAQVSLALQAKLFSGRTPENGSN